MDKRLKNVQQADLTESRVNDDFVYWLKTWGSNILIGILLVVAAVMGWQWWSQRAELERDSAWGDLKGARLPAALIAVAQQHGGKDSISLYAELSAADAYMAAIQRGVRFDREPGAADAAVTPELRTEWLKEADRLYAQVAQGTAGATSMGKQLMHIGALFGRAAVAEDQKDPTASEAFLKQVQSVVQNSSHAVLGEVAAARMANIRGLDTEIVFVSAPSPSLSPLPPSALVPTQAPSTSATPANPFEVNPDFTLTPGTAPAAPPAGSTPAPTPFAPPEPPAPPAPAAP